MTVSVAPLSAYTTEALEAELSQRKAILAGEQGARSGTPYDVALRLRLAATGKQTILFRNANLLPPVVYSTPFGPLTTFKLRDEVSGLDFEILVRQGTGTPR
jgi:hypothetical protein